MSGDPTNLGGSLTQATWCSCASSGWACNCYKCWACGANPCTCAPLPYVFTQSYSFLSDADVERIAKRVVELLKQEGK